MGADVVSREELYELVWSMPMVKVGERFKVSGSYMARVCSTLRVPRPERGYWAKLAVGKAPRKAFVARCATGGPTQLVPRWGIACATST
jgi:hypothetical protein